MWPFNASFPQLEPRAVDNFEFDYIIIGGGTAGCCLAARLTEDTNTTVLVIERGALADSWASRVPLLSANIYRGDATAAIWPISPLANANERVVQAVVGEGVGGGSRINSALYTRGIGDYNQWKDMGRDGWGYDDLEPYFVKSEHTKSQPSSRFRGVSGPWVNQTFPQLHFKILEHVNKAAKSLGISKTSDINSPDAPVVCCSPVDTTIDSSGHRHSTYRAFLPADVAAARTNLKFCTHALATRIEFSDASSKTPRATSILFEDTERKRDPRTYRARARKEIVLCAGAIASPQLLMLSGVGPRDHLKEHSIDIVKELPGVGSYLKDHVGLPVTYEIPMDDSLHQLKAKPFKAVLELLRYMIFGQGAFATPFVQFTIFVRSALLNDNMETVAEDASQLDARVPANTPDIEIMPVAHRCTEGPDDPELDKVGVFSFLTCLVKPKSYGTVRLTNSDPHTRATIDLGFLTHPDDIGILRKAVRLALRLADKVRTQDYPLKNLRIPESETDEGLDKFIREGVRTSYHYSSTCRMAPEDDVHGGVVDDELRVYGVHGLRVADTSVFPEIVTTHTMAGAVVVAEKCADLIKGQV